MCVCEGLELTEVWNDLTEEMSVTRMKARLGFGFKSNV